ncbi:MAG: hypothetical protein WCC12_15975, partial [Anaerolineales bacterium]
MSKRTIILKAEARETLTWLDDWFKQKIVEDGKRGFTPTFSLFDEVDEDANYWVAIQDAIKKAIPEDVPVPEGTLNKDFVRKLLAENISFIAEFSDLWMNQEQLILLVQARYSLVFGQQSPIPFDKNVNVFDLKCHHVGEYRTQVRVTCHAPEVVWMLEDLWQDIDIAFEVITNLPASSLELKSHRAIQTNEPGFLKREPQLQTKIKLDDLRKLREDAIKENHPIPKKQAAMDQVGGITDKTWSRHAPQL